MAQQFTVKTKDFQAISQMAIMPIPKLPTEKEIDSLSKLTITFLKLCILIGGAITIIYSLKIDHFPQDVSIGDGLLFFITAACFGLIYALFVLSLVSLGRSLSPFVRFIFKTIKFLGKLFHKNIPNPEFEFASFRWSAILFSLFSLFLILIFGRKDSMVYWSLPVLSITLYLFQSVYISIDKKIGKIKSEKSFIIITPARKSTENLNKLKILRETQLTVLFFIITLPLLIGGVSSQLLDAAMLIAHVRIENVKIYVKEPYSSLLPDNFTSKDKKVPKGYIAYEGGTVLFRGFGRTTVISFPHKGGENKFEIPNDQIIIGNN